MCIYTYIYLHIYNYARRQNAKVLDVYICMCMYIHMHIYIDIYLFLYIYTPAINNSQKSARHYFILSICETSFFLKNFHLAAAAAATQQCCTAVLHSSRISESHLLLLQGFRIFQILAFRSSDVVCLALD